MKIGQINDSWILKCILEYNLFRLSLICLKGLAKFESIIISIESIQQGNEFIRKHKLIVLAL